MYKKVLLTFLFLYVVIKVLFLYYPIEFEKMLPSKFDITHYDRFTVEKIVGNESSIKEFSMDEMRVIINYLNSLKYISYYNPQKSEGKEVESYFIRIISSKNDEYVDIRTDGKRHISIMHNRNIKFYKVLSGDINLDFLDRVFDAAKESKN